MTDQIPIRALANVGPGEFVVGVGMVSMMNAGVPNSIMNGRLIEPKLYRDPSGFLYGTCKYEETTT